MQPTKKMANTNANEIIAFFEGTGTDHRGRYLKDILSWSDEKLESCQDYIQTLFPLPEGSCFVPGLPLVDETVFLAFRYRHDIQIALLSAFERMAKFYGFKIQVDGTLQIQVSFVFCLKS
jgi:hypothetical protein